MQLSITDNDFLYLLVIYICFYFIFYFGKISII